MKTEIPLRTLRKQTLRSLREIISSRKARKVNRRDREGFHLRALRELFPLRTLRELFLFNTKNFK